MNIHYAMHISLYIILEDNNNDWRMTKSEGGIPKNWQQNK